MTNLTRREFVGAMTAGTTLVASLEAVGNSDADANDAFSFLLLGDTHFDRLEHHDFDWMRQFYAKDIPQVEGYSRHTQKTLPELLRAAKRAIRSSPHTPVLAAHVGDLVEGICGNPALAVRHCEEAWQFFQEIELGVPLLMTKGNHDVTGPGAAEAFEQVLLKRTAQQLGQDSFPCTSYAFQQGRCLFAFFDAYDPRAIDWLERLVHEADFRQLFVVLHLPVVPYNARATWRVYHHPRHVEQRRRLVDLLGQQRAIVLSGHLHKYSLLVRRTCTGRFVQLALSSIVKPAAERKQPSLAGLEAYGCDLVDLEPDFEPTSLEIRTELLTAERPLVEHFEYADVAGYAVISVTGSGVHAEVFQWPDEQPRKRIDLSGFLT